MQAVIDHYLARHKQLCTLVDQYNTPGNHCPGAVDKWLKDLRGIEAAIADTIRADITSTIKEPG
jgi:hypothetical protein